jgi:type IV secretion system protein VirB10
MNDKIDPSRLDLRAAPPHRVVRFRKSLVVGMAALGIGLILCVTMMALRPHRQVSTNAEELYVTDKKPTTDGLAALPGDYSEVRAKAIDLGPPLPGDLGRPIVAQQRANGVRTGATEQEQRLAQQSVQALEAGVFFRINDKPRSNAAASAVPAQSTAPATAAAPSDAGKVALDPERDQNNQQRKLDFLHQRDASSIYNPHALQTPASPYQVMAGSIIAASLITGVNSDLPGLVVAQVTENIYDTATGQTLLIPQGARLIGAYDSVVAFGQSRALLVWQRVVMPDGSSVQIDNLPATDTEGYAGLEDEVDYHTWALIKGVALSTMLGVGTQLSLGSNESDLVRALRQSTQQNVSQAGQRITEKNLNIQPTITIRPGWPVRVIVHKDIVLKPYREG